MPIYNERIKYILTIYIYIYTYIYIYIIYIYIYISVNERLFLCKNRYVGKVKLIKVIQRCDALAEFK